MSSKKGIWTKLWELPEARLRSVRTLKCYSDDIFVCSFPRSGSTWTTTIVRMVVHDGEPKSIHPSTYETGRDFPIIELDKRFVADYDSDQKTNMENIQTMARPRTLKSHLPYDLLPAEAIQNKSKIIHVSHNVKDVMVSKYHYVENGFMQLKFDSFGQYAELFMDEVPYWGALKSYTKNPDQSNILLITYEQLQDDCANVVTRIARFLGKDLDAGQVENIVQHSSFAAMKENPAVNNAHVRTGDGQEPAAGWFIREGKVGNWGTVMSPETEARIDSWIRKNEDTNV